MWKKKGQPACFVIRFLVVGSFVCDLACRVFGESNVCPARAVVNVWSGDKTVSVMCINRDRRFWDTVWGVSSAFSFLQQPLCGDTTREKMHITVVKKKETRSERWSLFEGLPARE
jgi:hypothetical protein